MAYVLSKHYYYYACYATLAKQSEMLTEDSIHTTIHGAYIDSLSLSLCRCQLNFVGIIHAYSWHFWFPHSNSKLVLSYIRNCLCVNSVCVVDADDTDVRSSIVDTVLFCYEQSNKWNTCIKSIPCIWDSWRICHMIKVLIHCTNVYIGDCFFSNTKYKMKNRERYKNIHTQARRRSAVGFCCRVNAWLNLF